MKKQELKVYYDSEDINTELDKDIEKVIKPFGYKWYASGYDLTKHKRDLAFDKSSCENCGSREHIANDCPTNQC